MKKLAKLTIILYITLSFSCQHDQEKSEQKNVNNVENTSAKTLNKDNVYNEISLFIAGRDTKLYNKIQNSKPYKEYQNKLNEAWNQYSDANLKNIKEWREKNHVIKNDTLPLLYPFSGPDFLYAHAFFPNALSYVLIGLENPGKLPDLNKMNTKAISKYLYNLYRSMRYVNQAGYFVTKHMQDDFSDSKMNGIIHLMCLYIAKTNHSLLDVKPIQINYFGKIEKKKHFGIDDELVNGLYFKIISADNKIKKIYYFPLDISDENIKDKVEFTTFIGNLSKKNTFFKSASYLMHNKNFSIIRNIVLKQSETIIQDDTGIPFAKLLSAGYDVKLFGNYTRTIGVFKTYFQEDLSQQLEEKRIGYLPFKFGYNSWHNDMVLLCAVSCNKNIKSEQNIQKYKERVVFKVQIKASWKKIPVDDDIFKALPPVKYYYKDNLYKYTIGSFLTEEACANYIKLAHNRGFKDAFIVAFYNKDRISMDRAKEILLKDQ